MKPLSFAGAGMIALGVSLNVPFGILGATFDYPDILRRPAGEILDRFHAGGAGLILTWYAFTLVALALIPVSVLLHQALLKFERPPDSSRLALATVAGVAAGLFQTLGLIRWVFVVPTLANGSSSAESRAAAEMVFQGLHQFLGVAVGEHLGQLCTALWVLLLARPLSDASWLGKTARGLALVSASLILVGLVEGFATVIPFDPGLMGVATPFGFITLSVWLVLAGCSLVKRPSGHSLSPPGRPAESARSTA